MKTVPYEVYGEPDASKVHVRFGERPRETYQDFPARRPWPTLLLKGGLPMRGLVLVVKRRASAACRGKDVAANIRARICWLGKKGYRIERGPSGRLKACSAHGR